MDLCKKHNNNFVNLDSNNINQIRIESRHKFFTNENLKNEKKNQNFKLVCEKLKKRKLVVIAKLM